MMSNPRVDDYTPAPVRHLVVNGKAVDPDGQSLAELKKRLMTPVPATVAMRNVAEPAPPRPPVVLAPPPPPAPEPKQETITAHFGVRKNQRVSAFMKYVDQLAALKPGESVVFDIPAKMTARYFRCSIQSISLRRLGSRFNSDAISTPGKIIFRRPAGAWKHGEPIPAESIPLVGASAPPPQCEPEQPAAAMSVKPAPTPKAAPSVSVSDAGFERLLAHLTSKRDGLLKEIEDVDKSIAAVETVRELLAREQIA